MKSLNKLIFLFILFLIAFDIFPQKSDGKKSYSVVIMPFDDYQEYPYNLDYIRQSLIIGFQQKGFNVIDQDSVWEIILDRDLRMTNLSTSDVEKISDDINVDLIVYGRSSNYSTFRQEGVYTGKIIDKPILVRVYDHKKREIVLFERLVLNSRWGLFDQPITFENFGSSIAEKLKSMGY